MARNIVSTDDLFAVCTESYGYKEPIARVLSNVLFWSQLAQHYFHGHLGIYKTDAELARDLHKHPKTVGRLLRHVSAPAEKEKPRTVFHTRYGPKPGAPGGRVRWLFRTELGNEIIDAAKAHAKARLSRKSRKQNAATDRREMQQSAAPMRGERSPQNVATHIKQKDFSDSQTESLSFAEAEREKPASYEKEKKLREEIKSETEESRVKRFVSLWNLACEERNRPELAWHPSDVGLWSQKLSTFIQERDIAQRSDEDIRARLRLLAGNLDWLSERMSPVFMRYNSDGLLIESFVRYSKRLWLAAGKKLAEKRNPLLVQSQAPSLKDYDISGKARELAKMEDERR